MQLLTFLLVCGLVGLGCVSAMFPGMTKKKSENFLYTILMKAAAIRPARGGETIPKLAETIGETKFVEYLTKARLIEKLETTGPFTAFGPTNGVFDGLPQYVHTLLKNETSLERIMKYCVMTDELEVTNIENDMMMPTLLGETYKIRFNKYKDDKVITASGRMMKMPGKKATNGMLFEMEGLLMPPAGPITQALSQCPDYKTMTKVLKMTEMDTMLMGKGPFTVFAPTDAAFEKIPKETLDALLKNTTALKEILMYHVMEGTFYTAAWTNKDTIKMASGKEATITEENDKFMVNTIPITFPDTTCDNGVTHVIDQVLMPPTAHLRIVFGQ